MLLSFSVCLLLGVAGPQNYTYTLELFQNDFLKAMLTLFYIF